MKGICMSCGGAVIDNTGKPYDAEIHINERKCIESLAARLANAIDRIEYLEDQS